MTDINGFILAGGQSSRMGGNTALLRLGNTTFVERAAAAYTILRSHTRRATGTRLQPKIIRSILRREFPQPTEQRFAKVAEMNEEYANQFDY